MSDTDSTYSMNPRAARPTALGDLRFAGTIAAGLVAGTLGLGALAAPLVGWKDWPSALTQQATQPARRPGQGGRAEGRATSSTPRKNRPTARWRHGAGHHRPPRQRGAGSGPRPPRAASRRSSAIPRPSRSPPPDAERQRSSDTRRPRRQWASSTPATGEVASRQAHGFVQPDPTTPTTSRITERRLGKTVRPTAMPIRRRSPRTSTRRPSSRSAATRHAGRTPTATASSTAPTTPTATACPTPSKSATAPTRRSPTPTATASRRHRRPRRRRLPGRPARRSPPRARSR